MRSTTIVRAAAIETAATGVCGGLGLVLVREVRSAVSSLDGAGAVVVLCELSLVVCLAWSWAATTAVVAEALAGQALPRAGRGVPRAWRRWVLAACGVALVAGVALPAQAAPRDGGPHHGTGRARDSALAGLPMPERAVAPAPRASVTRPAVATPMPAPTPNPTPMPAQTPRPTGPGVVEVVAGDSLWRIAERTLPLSAGDEAVTDRWRAVYRANRDVLGPDPDRITPGQRLDLPPAGRS